MSEIVVKMAEIVFRLDLEGCFWNENSCLSVLKLLKITDLTWGIVQNAGKAVRKLTCDIFAGRYR